MYIGIDCGTQGTKALVIDQDGTGLGRGYARHALIERSSGAREQEPSWWVEAMRSAVREALSTLVKPAEVRAIGVSGQQHGLVVLDEAFEVIRPAKLWNDTETASSNAEIIRRLGGREAFFERFGIVPLTGYTVSKLVWLAEHEPANFKRIRHILLPHDYLNFWLTGKLGAEYGDASGTAFFDVRTRAWAREVLDAIDGGSGHLFAALPSLLTPNSLLGRVRADVAEDLGISPECMVAAGGGDNMMGAIGTGNVREGVVTMSLGTSSTVYSYSSSVPQDPGGDVAPFCSSSGGWLPLVCTMNATNVVTATVQALGRTVTDIEAAFEKTQPGADGLVFLPFLNGERTPDLPHARGSLHGISATNFTADHLIRAAVEGVSFGILHGLDLILPGRSATVIQVIGGGARSRAWRQLLADATGAAIQVPLEEEAGCLGAAIQAMVALSGGAAEPEAYASAVKRIVRIDESATCSPRPEMRTAYDVARQAYSEQLRLMYP